MTVSVIYGLATTIIILALAAVNDPKPLNPTVYGLCGLASLFIFTKLFYLAEEMSAKRKGYKASDDPT